MKLLTQLFIIFAMIGALTRLGWAVDCPAGIPTTTVFHANGILVATPLDAQEGMDALETQFNQYLTTIQTPIQLGCIQFGFVYNQTQGFALDIYESYRQLSREEPTNIWLIGVQLLISSTPLFYVQAFLDVASVINPNVYLDRADLDMALQKYRAELFSAGHKVVVVSHSQGNLYANEAYNEIHNPNNGQTPLTTKSFGIVAVATPANFVAGYAAGQELYTTNTQDIIQRVPQALQGNVTASCGDDVILCHSFIGTYLESSVSRTHIFADIITVILSLVTPPPMPGSVHYLSFRGGNPGIPGDGIVVQADASGNVFTMVPMFSLSGVMNGITVSVFPPNPVPVNTGMFVQLGAIVDGLPVDSCRVAMSLSEGARPVVNGIVGIAAVFTQAFLDSTAEGLGRAIPACADATSDKFRLTSVQLFSQDFNFVSVVDAVAVGIGQNVFPQ